MRARIYVVLFFTASPAPRTESGIRQALTSEIIRSKKKREKKEEKKGKREEGGRKKKQEIVNEASSASSGIARATLTPKNSFLPHLLL